MYQLIELKGSSLSLKLYTDFIDEMKNTFGRPLVLGDLKMTTDFFVKQEKGEWIFFIEDKLEFEIKKKRSFLKLE